MKVKATKLGYYGHRRRNPGETFHIELPEHFSKKWMEKTEAPVEERPKAKKTSKKED